MNHEVMAMVMQPAAVLDLPLWTVGCLVCGIAAASAFVLHFLVSRMVTVEARRRHNPLTGSVFSIVGTTYAVLLAFVAMLAWENYNSAKSAVGREAASLYDVALTAAALPAPIRDRVGAGLHDYVEAVRTREWPAQARGEVSKMGDPSLARVAAVVSAYRPADVAQGNVQSALMAALSQLLYARDARLAAVATTIPSIVWFVVVAGGAVTLTFTSLLGGWDLRLHLVLATLLSVSGALVLFMILALSHPFRGDYQISPLPLQTALSPTVP